MCRKEAVNIPFLEENEPLTPEYVNALEKAIKSDGCTGVAEFHHKCCVVHDLGYRYHVDHTGKPATRSEVDAAFRRCMQQDSKFGRFDPISWVRWAGVRVFGRFFYKPLTPGQ